MLSSPWTHIAFTPEKKITFKSKALQFALPDKTERQITHTTHGLTPAFKDVHYFSRKFQITDGLWTLVDGWTILTCVPFTPFSKFIKKLVERRLNFCIDIPRGISIYVYLKLGKAFSNFLMVLVTLLNGIHVSSVSSWKKNEIPWLLKIFFLLCKIGSSLKSFMRIKWLLEYYKF